MIIRHRLRFLRFSLGLVFFWFNVLKYFPGFSPAENLATRTIDVLTLGTIPPAVSIHLLATWECAVGIALGCGAFLRWTLCLLFLHMACTFMPILFFPQEVFTHFPLRADLGRSIHNQEYCADRCRHDAVANGANEQDSATLLSHIVR